MLSVAQAAKFNQWMFETIRPFVNGSVLEVGSGIGNISEFFLEHKFNITLSDYDDIYISQLESRFSKYSNLEGILKIDLQHPEFASYYTSLKNKFDTVILLNVLEHLKDDKIALANAGFVLKPGGCLVVLTPSYQFMYSSLDKELGHYRRYTLKKLGHIFTMNNFEIQKKFYFNLLGIIAWLYGKLLKLKSIPSGEMKFYNKLVPLGKFLDRVFFYKAGLSVIMVARKKQ